MCGIAGIVGPGAEAHHHLVARMLGSLDHRGPDDVRTQEVAGAVIGATRLAVIDPEHGHQPLVDPAGLVVAGNGEIYGYRSLRRTLGMDPDGGSDLNVVAPLWRRHGARFLHHLPGTFALSVYDPASRKLLLARDPFGERPLYWASWNDGLVAFASEPRALLDAGLVEGEVDEDVLADVVRTGYVAPGTCIWRGMRSLLPGHLLEVDRRGRASTTRWWEAPPVDDALDLADAVPWMRQELDRAVAEQLDADVGVGVLLSGGLDSTTVAALAARHRRGLRAFSFDLAPDSEVAWARRTSEAHGLDLHVCTVDHRELVDDLFDAARSWDEPLGDSSSVLTWRLARFAREHVTVVLTGDGADELLGGYSSWARQALAARGRGRPLARWWRHRTGRAGSAIAQAYAGHRSYASADGLARLGLPARTAEEVDTRAYRWGTVEDICRFDLDHYLPGDILVKTDRASMAHGLEVRAPFLDRRVAEGCLALPASCKVDDRRQKVVLHEAFGHLWPDGLAERPKQGFGAPVERWLASPAVVRLVDDLVLDPQGPLADLVDHGGVAPVIEAGGQAAWTLLSIALWWEHHRPSVLV